MKDDCIQKKISRKDFLKMGCAIGATIAASSIPKEVLAADEHKQEIPKAKWKQGDDILLRMQDDVNSH